jgi:hypothetical protein
MVVDAVAVTYIGTQRLPASVQPTVGIRNCVPRQESGQQQCGGKPGRRPFPEP